MFRPLATSALALILGAGAALADLTPAQVWENIERSLTDAGSEVEIGARDDSGDRLVLDNVTLRSPDDAEASFSMTFPRMVFEGADGGQVRSVIEGDTEFTIRSTNMDDEDVSFDIVVQMPGNETLSSGTTEDMRHVYTIPELRITGAPADAEGDAPVVITMSDIAGDQTIRLLENGGNDQTYDIRAANMDMAIDGENTMTENGEEVVSDSFRFSMRIEDLTLTGEGHTPGGVAGFDADPAEALRAGLRANGTIGLGASSGSFETVTRDWTGQPQDGSGSFAAESGEMTVALSEEGLTFGSAGTNMSVEMNDPSSGMPIAYDIAEASMRLLLPMLASEEEQPFALSYILGGVTLDESLWSIFDPEAQLPREPANLAIDVEGQALLVTDLMDADAAESEEMPIMPRSLTVNRLSMDAVGASAEVTGALTFGDDPTQPSGSMTGDFTGIDTLLNTLVAMGALPQEQLMGTRMMMAMFARPVDGDANRLRTEMEFREDGSIYANGQQVK